jgi:hypothetical protein
MAKQATDTFTMDLPDGTQGFAVKGTVLPDRHPLVRAVPGMFAEFDADEADAPKSDPEPDPAVEPEVPAEPGTPPNVPRVPPPPEPVKSARTRRTAKASS